MTTRRYAQVDVFSSDPLRGNGLAVVLDGDGLSSEQMQRFAQWTNLAETTFLLPPADPKADYTIRIFTPKKEMLFAGHPTLGSVQAWLNAGGQPKTLGKVVQDCKIGLVDIDVSGNVPAFAAPQTKIAPLPKADLDEITTALDLSRDAIKTSALLDNGPVWKLIELDSADAVLEIDASKVTYPDYMGISLIGAYPDGSECTFETRNITPSSGMLEDPITGSMNAAISHWLHATSRLNGPVVISQGTALGCTGRVHITPNHDGQIWIGGNVNSLIEGTLTL